MRIDWNRLMQFCFVCILEFCVLRVQEGEIVNFIVFRNGFVDGVCIVQYVIVDGKVLGEEGDFVFVEKGEIFVFEVGSREQSIFVYVKDDGILEIDEFFYIVLFNLIGK